MWLCLAMPGGAIPREISLRRHVGADSDRTIITTTGYRRVSGRPCRKAAFSRAWSSPRNELCAILGISLTPPARPLSCLRNSA